jgi:hypothetical protein
LLIRMLSALLAGAAVFITKPIFGFSGARMRSTHGRMHVVILTTTGASSWTVPADWTLDNSVEVVGGGAGGQSSSTCRGGGGGGAYSRLSNIATLNPGDLVSIQVGTGGTTTTAGGDNWFIGATTAVAKGGGIGSGTTGGTGGPAASGYGDTGAKF